MEKTLGKHLASCGSFFGLVLVRTLSVIALTVQLVRAENGLWIEIRVPGTATDKDETSQPVSVRHS